MKKIFLLCLFVFIESVDINKAVDHLVSHARSKSVGLCAKYVADALEAGGFKFTRQPSAYLYRTKGILTGMGYREIGKQSSYAKGDITVTDKNGAHEDGHIAMWSGHNWISDFVQKSEFVYSNNQPPVYYYRYSSDPTPTPTPTSLKFTYAVRIANGKILSAVTNTEDYAGIRGQAITDIAIKVNKGSIKYRVHVKGGNWLGYVTGYNWNDAKNGYAGNHKPIDLVEIIYSGNNELPKYRVSPVNSGYYGWQYGNKVGKGYDGYAGYLGKTIDRIQISP